MFREMLRKKQQLPEEECIRILKEELRGVLSVLYVVHSSITNSYC